MVSSVPLFRPHIDQTLAAAAQAGSHGAFTILVERYDAPLRRFFIRATGDRELAADLAQDTFLELFRTLSRYDPARCFAPWLYGIAANRARMAARQRHCRPTISLDRLTDEIGEDAIRALWRTDPSSVVDDQDAVQRALDALDEEARMALLLTKLVGLTAREAGRALGVSQAAIWQRVHWAEAAFCLSYTAVDGRDEHLGRTSPAHPPDATEDTRVSR